MPNLVLARIKGTNFEKRLAVEAKLKPREPMIDRLLWGLRWATGGAIAFTLATWLVAVAFALVGFKRTAEGINVVVLYAIPVDAALLTLLVLALVVRWITRLGKTAR